jgi:hypothetical protein
VKPIQLSSIKEPGKKDEEKEFKFEIITPEVTNSQKNFSMI